MSPVHTAVSRHLSCPMRNHWPFCALQQSVPAEVRGRKWDSLNSCPGWHILNLIFPARTKSAFQQAPPHLHRRPKSPNHPPPTVSDCGMTFLETTRLRVTADPNQSSSFLLHRTYLCGPQRQRISNRALATSWTGMKTNG